MAIALVAGQNISASGTYNATAAHFNNTVVAGNTILVAIAHNDSLNHVASSVTDSAGSTYVLVGNIRTAFGINVELWAAYNCASF